VHQRHSQSDPDDEDNGKALKWLGLAK